MHNLSRLLLSLTLCAASAPALAAMAGPAARPGAGIFTFPLQTRPHPPGIFQPKPGIAREGWRRAYPNAFLGGTFDPYWGYPGAAAAPAAYPAPVVGGEYLRTRSVVYNVQSPVSQGDLGYVAQPAVYDVGKILSARTLKRGKALH